MQKNVRCSILENERADVFADPETISQPPEGSKREMRLLDAISEALDQSMEAHPELILMGQDMGLRGCVQGHRRFAGTLWTRAGTQYTALRIGHHRRRTRAVHEGHEGHGGDAVCRFRIRRMTQICNNLAKIHYRWGQRADVVIRMPTGAGVAAGPAQSEQRGLVHAYAGPEGRLSGFSRRCQGAFECGAWTTRIQCSF